MYYREESSFEEWRIPEVDKIKGLRVMMAFDVEYQPQVTKTIPIGKRSQEVKQRRMEDIISMQIAFNYRNIHPMKFFIHRDPDEPTFRFSDILQCLKQYLKSIHQYKLIQAQLKAKPKSRLTVELWGFFMGVDLSSLQDWQDILTEGHAENKLNPGKIVTLHANTVFTAQPLKLNVRDHYRHSYNLFPNQLSLVLRDETKLAPGKSNLAKLGDLVGVPKLNTEDWDRKYHKPVGYYKEHMTVLWKEHPDLFIKYAMMDTVITALYGSFMLEFQKQLMDDGLGKFNPAELKASLGSIISNVINQKNTEPADWIIEKVYQSLRKLKGNHYDTYQFIKHLCHFSKPDLAHQQINILTKHLNDHDWVREWLATYLDFNTLRKGYYFNKFDDSLDSHHKPHSRDLTSRTDKPLATLFDDFRKAFHGGFNVVTTPGIIPDHGYKKDLDLKAAYNTSGHLINDVAPTLGLLEKSFVNVPSSQFKQILQFAKRYNGPYTIGVGVFDIKYQNQNGFVITPQRINDGPRYFKDLEEVTLTFTDVYTAWLRGAKIYTHRLSFPMQAHMNPQTMQNVCNEGAVQDIFQQRRIQYPKGNPLNIMYKNVGNQAYGTTGEGLREKHSKDFNNNLGYYIPFSSITSPIKAAQFTAITRLHIVLLQKAIWQVDPHARFLNNVTDGCLIWTDQPLDYDQVNQVMNDLADPLYRQTVQTHFNGIYFEPKDGTENLVANLRSRLTFSPDGQLHAMVGINAHKLSPDEVFKQYLARGQVSIPEKYRKITGLNEMRHQLKFDHLQNSWEEPANLPLGYDFSLWPTNYHKQGQFVYWDTRPYKNAQEFEKFSAFGKTLVKYAPFYRSEYALFFSQTLLMYAKYQKAPKKFGCYVTDNKQCANELYYAWALYVAINNLELSSRYQTIISLLKNKHLPMRNKQNRVQSLPQLDAFKKYVQRHQTGQNTDVINYVLLHRVGLI